MSTFKPKEVIMVSAFLFHLSAYDAASSDTNTDAKAQTFPTVRTDTTSYETLVITKIKKPWYAWRSLVISKMKRSIPEYQTLEGLQEKYYLFVKKQKLFGGIYVWQDQQSAENWFNQAWFDRIEKKYGKKGEVAYYQIESIQSFAVVGKVENKFWAVLTYPTTKSERVPANQTPGLIKIIFLKDEAGQKCFLTLWQNKVVAEEYFLNKEGDHSFFDTPILLDNSRQKIYN